jgi:hypothetical protein
MSQACRLGRWCASAKSIGRAVAPEGWSRLRSFATRAILTYVLARKLESDGVTAGLFDNVEADWIVEASGRDAGDGIFAGEQVGYFVHIADWRAEDATTVTATDRDGYSPLLIPRAGSTCS